MNRHHHQSSLLLNIIANAAAVVGHQILRHQRLDQARHSSFCTSLLNLTTLLFFENGGLHFVPHIQEGMMAVFIGTSTTVELKLLSLTLNKFLD